MTAPLRLLVVDDPADLAGQVRHLLALTGREYHIEALSGPQQLIERVDAGTFDAVILGHLLATPDGTALLRQLHGSRRAPPIIVITGSQDPSLPDAYLELGAAGFLLQEELSPGRLDRSIRYAVAEWRARRSIEDGQAALLRNERMATIGRLSAGVAHEYNNLNAVVLAGFELLLGQVRGNKTAAQQTQRILDSLERGRRISQSLMLLSRAPEPTDEVIDLRKQVADSIALLDALEGQYTRVRFSLRLPDTPCPVRINPNDLHQVLCNLAINAMHAVHASSAPRLRIQLDMGEGWASLAFSDNGAGIAAEDMPFLFEPFYSRSRKERERSGRPPSDADGLGLGLAVCRSLVEQAGGTITAESSLGLGTTMTISLPIVADRQPEPTRPAGTGSGPRPTIGCVVLLDDNVDLVENLASLLVERGIEALSFSDPKRFITAFPGLRADVVAMDWHLPGLSGAEVLARIANPARDPPLRVILFSGSDLVLPDPPPPGIRFLGFLAKPFPVRRFLEMLSQP